MTSAKVDTPQIEYGGTDSESLWLHPIILNKALDKSQFTAYCDSEISAAISYLVEQSFRDNWNPPTDLFAFAFICLSRYEEYVIGDVDEHNRFISTSSFLSKENVLQHPIVDYVLLWFIALVKAKTNVTLELGQHRSTHLTFDIDHCWKYQHKGPVLNLLGIGKDLITFRFGQLKERLKVLTNNKIDPYDISLWLDRYDTSDTIFFFLLNNRNTYDKGHHPDNPRLKSQIKTLQETYEIGIHPGYYTMSNEQRMAEQFDYLVAITTTKPTLNRQHYLRLKFPETYRQLLQLGIKQDYTMGYADNLGFRAGTSRPFYWYDLLAETETSLQIQPFILMDMTLYKYLQFGEEQAEKAAAKLYSRCQSVNGTFRFIWHNSSPIWEKPWNKYQRMFDQYVDSKS